MLICNFMLCYLQVNNDHGDQHLTESTAEKVADEKLKKKNGKALGQRLAPIITGFLQMPFALYTTLTSNSPQATKVSRVADITVNAIQVGLAAKAVSDGFEEGVDARAVIVEVLRHGTPVVCRQFLPIKGQAGGLVGTTLGKALAFGAEFLFDKYDELKETGHVTFNLDEKVMERMKWTGLK